MRIRLGNKTKPDIVFFRDVLYNQYVIQSRDYGIDIYKGLDWTSSEPWAVNNSHDTEEKYKKPLVPQSLPKKIFINPYDEYKDLHYFLRELYEIYQIKVEVQYED